MTAVLNLLLGSGGGFTPVTVSYTTNGSFTETIPAGATTAVIEVFGASGDGGAGFGSGCTMKSGGGGGSGAYAKTTFNVSTQGGKTFDLVVANRNTASNTTVSAGATNGVTSFTQMVAPFGGNGGNASSGINGTGGTAASTATGGTDTNLGGNAGGNGLNCCSGGAGGAGRTGTNGNGGVGGTGGMGGANTGRTNGLPGRVYIRYT